MRLRDGGHGGPRGRARPVLRALAGLAAAATAQAASARPPSLDDVLGREAFGVVELAAGGRLLAELRGGPDTGAHFDYRDAAAMFRTRLEVADTSSRGPLRPLFRRASGAGYALGPVSPDGRWAAVYRLDHDRYQLGVVDVRARRARWLAVTPEAPGLTRSLQWTPADQLVAIVLQPGERPPPQVQPYDLRAVRPQWRAPPLWAATGEGRVSVTLAGSGRYIADHPPGPSKGVVRISPRTGRILLLARGEAIDLSVSPSGRHVAILTAAEPIALQPDHAVQGVYGLAVRRTRLTVVDLDGGPTASPCPGCDVLTGLLAWAPDREALLVFSRDDGAPWTAGRLMRVDAKAGSASMVATDVAPTFGWRPERVLAGWWMGDPILLGRRPGDARDDWFRLSGAGPVRLTGELPEAPRDQLVIAGGWLMAAAGQAAWAIDPQGRARRLTGQEAFRPLPSRFENVPPLDAFGVRQAGGLAGALGDGASTRAGLLSPQGELRHAAALPPNVAIAALDARGAAVIVGVGGGPQTLAWRPTKGAPRTLLTINRRLAEVAWPSPVPVDQIAPDGSLLRHWVLLPEAARAGRPASLVVAPYPGSAYRDPPEIWSDDAMAPAIPLLAAGYAVLLPSLPNRGRSPDGPMPGLAARVLAAVDAAGRTAGLRDRLDVSRLGVWGFSFGASGAMAMLAQTDRFSAAVAVAGRSDLVSSWGQFSPARRMNPDAGPSTYYSAGWTEDLQGDMRAPPWAAPQRYVANSPIFQADRIRTPLLLAVGDMDAAHLGQAEEMFSALYRQDKDAVLATYWGEAHGFASPGNVRDLYRRGIAFLDAYLRPNLVPAPVPAPRTGHPHAGHEASSPRMRTPMPARGQPTARRRLNDREDVSDH